MKRLLLIGVAALVFAGTSRAAESAPAAARKPEAPKEAKAAEKPKKADAKKTGGTMDANTRPACGPGSVAEKSEEEWMKELGPEKYRILRQKGTERAFTGKYWDHHGKGTYKCAACGAELFASDTKFESGSGWPSFYQPAEKGAVKEETDSSHGMVRTEVLCAKCGGHLGHVFDDGPQPTNLRYCINSAALDFEEEK